MTQAHKTPGNIVRIKPKCFDMRSAYYPHYNDYVNHKFEVITIEEGNHITLKCTTGLLDNNGNPRVITVHDDEIVSVRRVK